MANLDFYAQHDDLISLLEFLWDQTDIRIFDSYSGYDEELAELLSVQALEERYSLLVDKFGHGPKLKLWSPSVMSEVYIRRIDLNPERCEGHTFRYCIEGGGLMNLYLGSVKEKAINHTHFGHWSQKGAAAWGKDEGVDWVALAKLSNKIQYHIRSRLAVAKFASRPILPQAFDLILQGYQIDGFSGNALQYIVEKSPSMRPDGKSKSSVLTKIAPMPPD